MFRSCYAKSLIYVTMVDCIHCGSEEYELLLAVSGREQVRGFIHQSR